MIYKKIVKPCFDVFAALCGLIVLSPIFLVILIVNLFVNNGKPFYFSRRPGKNERVYSIIKFKSMNDKKDENGEFLPFQERVTKFGKFMRRNSLDEIPQLINVLKRDMSLIGPRPLLVKYLPLYNKRQSRRHEVMSGLTGWAQVNGRNSINWEEKFELDIYYVDNQSFLLDLKILFLTFYKVIKKDDINATENNNMPAFTGTKAV